WRSARDPSAARRSRGAICAAMPSKRAPDATSDGRERGRAHSPNPKARREKVPCILPVKVRPGELSVRPSSYRGGRKGNCPAKALGTWAHVGWVGEPTGRNTCEARVSLESEVVRVDLLFGQGRPLDSVGATDR